MKDLVPLVARLSVLLDSMNNLLSRLDPSPLLLSCEVGNCYLDDLDLLLFMS